MVDTHFFRNSLRRVLIDGLRQVCMFIEKSCFCKRIFLIFF